MSFLRILFWGLVLVILIYISAFLVTDVFLPEFGANTSSPYTLPAFNVSSGAVTVYTQNFEEIYLSGLNTPTEVKTNFDEPFLILERGNKTFLNAVLDLLKTDAWNVRPEQYQIIVDLASFLNLKPAEGYLLQKMRIGDKYIEVYSNETVYVLKPLNDSRILVLKLKKLNISKIEIPYPPSADITLYNFSWIEQYTLVLGDAELDYKITSDEFWVKVTPKLWITNDGVHIRYQYGEPYEKCYNISGKTGTWTFEHTCGYFNGFGPLYYVKIVAKKTQDSCWIDEITVKRRYLYFERWNYTFYPLLKIYKGNHPIYVNVIAEADDGTILFNKTYNASDSEYCYPEYGICYIFAPFHVSIDSAEIHSKRVKYKITIFDYIKVGKYKIKRVYKVGELEYLYRIKGDLPDWDSYSFISVDAELIENSIRQAPEWAKHEIPKLDKDYLSKYLLFLECRWINEKIKEFANYDPFDVYVLDSQLVLNIYPSNKPANDLSREALNALFNGRGNASAINYLSAILLGLGNYVHINYGSLKWYNKQDDLVKKEGYIIYTHLEKVPEFYNDCPYIETDRGRAYLIDLVYQKSPTAIWLWLDDNGYITPLVDPLHRTGKTLQFYVGFVDYPFKCYLDVINVKIKGYNMTFGIETLKRAKNFEEFKEFI